MFTGSRQSLSDKNSQEDKKYCCTGIFVWEHRRIALTTFWICVPLIESPQPKSSWRPHGHTNTKIPFSIVFRLSKPVNQYSCNAVGLMHIQAVTVAHLFIWLQNQHATLVDSKNRWCAAEEKIWSIPWTKWRDAVLLWTVEHPCWNKPFKRVDSFWKQVFVYTSPVFMSLQEIQLLNLEANNRNSKRARGREKKTKKQKAFKTMLSCTGNRLRAVSSHLRTT